jgi:hypothetical protein
MSEWAYSPIMARERERGESRQGGEYEAREESLALILSSSATSPLM